MLSFKGMLIHDITNQGFADIYSQTIAYGLFAARYHDPTLEDFSRQEAANLIYQLRIADILDQCSYKFRVPCLALIVN